MSDAINALFDFLKSALTWLLDGLLWLLGKVLFLVFDGILTVITAAFNAIDFSSFLSSYAMDWAGLPPQMIWFINAVGIPQGITILSSAIVVRMLLNLIPAAVTRV